MVVEVRQNGGSETVIVCKGELDLASAGDLSAAVAWSFTTDLRTLVVDATNVGFCDSSGLRSLLSAAYQCQKRQIQLTLTASDELARTLRLCGLAVQDAPTGGMLNDLSAAVTDAVAAKLERNLDDHQKDGQT